ncbi:alpha-amlyase [Mucilaginibacter hurinus]|uniref:Alpha-amlyase n=1 Tax=Mucilaginibacter hurinus TaxID=2201324 RepID=A0A367GRH1_9SPHI|nr:glycoside hydrolase family 13 protein [Mucilaginibacter hurinus]RCH55860.1 alpha-amlyase [Mucilaginibacter hurinus]
MKTLLSLSFFFLALLSASAQTIERMEPANWWTGMKYDTVNVLFYGKDISHLRADISYPGVTLIRTDTVANKNYLFLTLYIMPAAKPGIVNIRFNRLGKTVVTKKFPLLQREPNSAQRASFSQKDAIYLVFPDRFSNGNVKNDIQPALLEKTINRGNEDARHGGDIQGILNHLDYISDLGFTYIWNTPLVENDEPSYSYHGYAATDFYRIDPRFGSNEDFKKLVVEAHKRGIGVIWDVVLNHCGSEYYFIKDMPEKNWVNFPDTHIRTTHLKSTVNDRYATAIDKMEYVGGWFDGHMSDLNQANPRVAAFLIQNTIWWIEYAGISGLRVDTFSYSDKDFLTEWTKTILLEYPNMNIVGEEMTRIVAETAYWQKDKVNPDQYKCYLPTLMDFSLNDNIVSALNRSGSWFSSWRDVYFGIAQDYHFPYPGNQLIFPDNHDLDRFYSRVGKNFQHWKLGIAMYATMRGIPQFFYGTEVLMTNEKAGSDGQRRSDLYGGWLGDSKNVLTGKGLTDQEKEAQQYLKKLLHWRKANPDLMNGKYIHYGPGNNDVFVYSRFNAKQKVVVFLNKNSDDVTLDLERYREVIPLNSSAKDIINGRLYLLNDKLTLPAKTAIILELIK